MAGLQVVVKRRNAAATLTEHPVFNATTLAARELRLNCACAECVEEWTNRKLLDPTTIIDDIQAEDFLMVGKYAALFLWSDGHYTGIYPYGMLRALSEGASGGG